MGRHLQRSLLLCLFAGATAGCSSVTGATNSGSDVLPSVQATGQSPAAATPTTVSASDVAQASKKTAGYVTIQGVVTSVLARPYFHVVATVSKASVSIYSSYLHAAKAGDTVRATGFYNSLGNFQAASALIVTGSGSASPSPPPKGHPTPVPTVAPIPTPTPVAFSGPAISQFQIFDFNINGRESTTLAPSLSQVWGAGDGDAGANPHTWLAGNSSLTAILYFTQGTDYKDISYHNLTWWQHNHPNWIVYDCDQNNQPTHTVAFQPGLPGDVPLDIHNPDVVSYQIHTAASFAIARGDSAIGADQTLFFDFDGNQQPGWYGCGVYAADGTFIRRWGSGGGGFPNRDPQWNHDVAAWVKTAKSILTTDSALASHHIKLFLNHPAGSLRNPDEQTVLANADAIMDEGGFTDYGHYAQVPGLFKSTLDYMDYAQRHGVQVLDVAKFSGSLVGDARSFGLTAGQLSYAIATYLMANEGRAALFVTPGRYGKAYSFPQIATVNARLGSACGTYTTTNGIYVRKFTHGMALVNPGMVGTVTVPTTHAYVDLTGRAIGARSVSVPPADSFVLLTNENGCT